LLACVFVCLFFCASLVPHVSLLTNFTSQSAPHRTLLAPPCFAPTSLALKSLPHTVYMWLFLLRLRVRPLAQRAPRHAVRVLLVLAVLAVSALCITAADSTCPAVLVAVVLATAVARPFGAVPNHGSHATRAAVLCVCTRRVC
jgi:hypothetical protein